MKREQTIVVCERCGKEITLRASKLGPIRKSAPYPKNWAKIWKKKKVCENCNVDFIETWEKYMRSGIVKQEIELQHLKH